MAEMAAVKDEIRVYERPHVLVVEFSGAATDEMFREYLDKMDDIHSQRSLQGGDPNERGAILFDTTDATRPVTASQRKMQSDFMTQSKAKYGDDGSRAIGVCFVITNTLVRGVLTALMWMNPFRKETVKVVATRALADEWCRSWVVGTAKADSEQPGSVL